MNKIWLNFILLALLMCLVPNTAFADNTEVQASVTVINNKINDLAVADPTYTSLSLTWTSPQSSPPNWGPAKHYDIRYSPSPITTDTEWQSATQLANPPDPQPAGSPETLLVIGLNTCTTYCFAIKSVDAKETWTSLSNSPQGATLCYSIGGGGGEVGLPGPSISCPVTLAADMQGNVTTASMTSDGVLCDACLAKDTSGKNTLELDKNTRVMLAGNVVPLLLRVRIASVSIPTVENTVIIGPVYEFDAYASPSDTTPSPLSISPSARLILSYDPSQLPENTTEVFIANYNTTEGWLALTPVPGAVAEIGKAHGLLNHFSIYAVLAKVEAPLPATFKVSNLTVSPLQIQLNQDVSISVDVSNTSEKNSDYTLDLNVDGAIKSSKHITLAAGKSQTVNFTTTGDTIGKHQVEIANLIGEFEVVKAAGPFIINWWLIASIIGIVIVLAIWSIVGWRWFKELRESVTASDKHSSKPD